MIGRKQTEFEERLCHVTLLKNMVIETTTKNKRINLAFAFFYNKQLPKIRKLQKEVRFQIDLLKNCFALFPIRCHMP